MEDKIEKSREGEEKLWQKNEKDWIEGNNKIGGKGDNDKVQGEYDEW